MIKCIFSKCHTYIQSPVASWSKIRKKINGGCKNKRLLFWQDIATMQFCANKLDKKDFFGKSDPFLVFYRSNEDGTWVCVLVRCVLSMCLLVRANPLQYSPSVSPSPRGECAAPLSPLFPCYQQQVKICQQISVGSSPMRSLKASCLSEGRRANRFSWHRDRTF